MPLEGCKILISSASKYFHGFLMAKASRQPSWSRPACRVCFRHIMPLNRNDSAQNFMTHNRDQESRLVTLTSFGKLTQ